MTRAGDDAERSDEEERRMIPAGDDAERSDEQERRMIDQRDSFAIVDIKHRPSSLIDRHPAPSVVARTWCHHQSRLTLCEYATPERY
jgi:hypothetical protein